MAYTSYLSDIHGNTELLKAYRIVNNHLASQTDNAATVFAGDFSSNEALHKGKDYGLEGVEKEFSKEYKSMDEIISQFSGEKYAIKGNHDTDSIKKYMPSLNFIDDEEGTTDINGRKHYAVYHSTSHIFKQREDGEYPEVEEREDLEDRVNESDVLVTHEGVIDELATGKGHYNKRLHDAALKRAKKGAYVNVCGHAHGSKYTEKDGLVGIRPYSESEESNDGGKEGAMFFVLHNGDKDIVYKVKNSKVMEYAKELAGDEFGESSQESPYNIQREMQDALKNAFEREDSQGNQYVALKDNYGVRYLAEHTGMQPRNFEEDNNTYLAFPKEEFEQVMQKLQQQQSQQQEQEEEEPEEEAA